MTIALIAVSSRGFLFWATANQDAHVLEYYPRISSTVFNIQRLSSDEFRVHILRTYDGAEFFGTSISHSMSPNYAQYGEEITSTTVHAHGTWHDVGYEVPHGKVSAKWWLVPHAW